MRYGELVGEDAYGREIKVGDVIDVSVYYNLKTSIYRTLVIGVTGGGNYRTLLPLPESKGLNGYVSWEYPKKPLKAVEVELTGGYHTDQYKWVNEYLRKGQPKEMFREALSTLCTPKKLKQYKLEID